MSASYRRLAYAVAMAGALVLSACSSNTPSPQEAAAPAAPEQPAIPSKYRPEDIVGRWGYGAFHRDEDLARTAAAARQQCGQPVEITRGPNGGVMMYLADSAQLQELQLKGSQNGANYIGPPGAARRHAGSRDRVVRRPHHGAANGWIRKSPADTAPASMCVARLRAPRAPPAGRR